MVGVYIFCWFFWYVISLIYSLWFFFGKDVREILLELLYVFFIIRYLIFIFYFVFYMFFKMDFFEVFKVIILRRKIWYKNS